MSSILDKINNTIVTGCRHALNNTSVVLLDTSPHSDCSNITLIGEGRILACKFDNAGIINLPFLTPGEAHEMCDYLVFYESNNKPNFLFVFVCELQSKSKTDKKAESQMRAGFNLACFLIETSRKILNYNTTTAKVVFKGVRFSTRPPQKVYNRRVSQEAWKVLIPQTEVRYLEVLCGETYYIEDTFM